MKRGAEISYLRNLYNIYMAQRKHKAASFVLVRLRELMRKQLEAENRIDRKEGVA